MKGIIFTELLELVEDTFSIDTAEEVIEQADLPSGGGYTSVGTYDHTELLSLVAALSNISGMPVRDLVMAYGKHLFKRFTELYPSMFEGVACPLDFIESVESHIHVEVRKLYPDAELPTFEPHRLNGHTLNMIYRSSRPLADVAEALIRGCMEHFGRAYDVTREEQSDADGQCTHFQVRLLQEKQT